MAKRPKASGGLFAQIARRPSRKPPRLLPRKSEGIPGPSENQATNFMMADIAIRAGSYLARRGVEKALLAGRYGKETAKEIVANKTLGQTAISFVLARVATRSVPGAILVGGGALAKTLLERRKSRLHSKAEGDLEMLDQARGE